MDWGPRITYLASTALKKRVVPFGIKDEDRLKHVCVLGKVGSGRAELLARMVLQDYERGLGALVLDASGNLGPMIMERLPREGLDKLIHVDAADAEYPFSIDFANEFRNNERGAMLWNDALASIYGVKRDPLTEYLAAHVLKSVGRTVLDPYVLLTDEKELNTVLPPDSADGKTFAELRATHQETAQAIVENGRYLVKDTMVRNSVGQREGRFSLSALAEGAIIIVDLSRIRIFPTRIGPIVKLFSYAFRARMGGGAYAALYLHDCLRYYTESDAEALITDNAFALTLSDTVYRESDLPLREKILSRCGSYVAFEPHQSDVPLVERLFYPYVKPEELQGLESGESCVMLTIDAVRTRPFFATSLPLAERLNVSLQDILVEARNKYTFPRATVDQSFKKQADKDKKSGQPPFADAFKNIFAKRDPAKALAQGEKKPDASKPQPEAGMQQAVAEVLLKPAAVSAAADITPTAKVAHPAVDAREIPEDELRALLYVAPLAA